MKTAIVRLCTLRVLPVALDASTEGNCDVGLAFHIESGEFNGVSLESLNFRRAAYSPECMGAGSWNTAIYIDEKAADEQRSVLERILSWDI